MKPNPKLRKPFLDRDFSEILVKGRQSRGNMLTKLDVQRVVFKAHGVSTLGGRKVWFDADVQRLNYDERGTYLGEFHGDEAVLVIHPNGDYYTTTYDPNNHYEGDILRIEKYDPEKVWTAALFDGDQQGFPYLKRFLLERTSGARRNCFLNENPATRLLLLTDTTYPRFELVFGGADAYRDPIIIEADEFVTVKGFKAKGKRLTTNAVESIKELEPLRVPEADKAEAAASETETAPADDQHPNEAEQEAQDLFNQAD